MSDDRPDREEVEEIVKEYHEYEIETPIPHPITALKSHNIQFGLVIGFLLGAFAHADVMIEADLLVTDVALDAVSASVLIMIMVAFYAIGFKQAGAIEAAEADDGAVGVAQIRRKPHYFVTPMVVSWVITYTVLLVV